MLYFFLTDVIVMLFLAQILFRCRSSYFLNLLLPQENSFKTLDFSDWSRNKFCLTCSGDALFFHPRNDD